MIGALQLVPNWMLAGHDAILAADIGGTNVRAGVVTFRFGRRESTLSECKVLLFKKWRHTDDETPSRTRAVERLTGTLQNLARRAQKRRLRLAPFVGIGCPGIINSDGSIKAGGQNLPGNWESDNFNLAIELAKALPTINGEPPLIIIHNDAVLQGLSEVPNMLDVKRWAVLTIGTGLGNARFTSLGQRGRRGSGGRT
ncbi:MAG TPA: ROK family protein [Candidatus Binataceae bacterium]|nr:ROK family protein [Candidatus Binataceae bacterium]